VNARVIAAMKKARIIVRYGIGVDNVDLEAARQRGIPVCNVPNFCIDEVADHTLGFILSATRQIIPNCLHVREGKWGLAGTLAGMRTLRDLTVGVVGFGRIGQAVVRRLLPFGCAIRVFDPFADSAQIEKMGVTVASSLDELLPAVDLLTLHCPSTPQTRGMLNESAFAKMKKGAIFANLARGDVVNTPALVAALQQGHLAAALLDVCDQEPIPPDHPLLKMPNVILSAHVSSASPRAVRTLRETAAGLVAKRLRGEPLLNVVNRVSE
jgi:D-3-phosphoglycerate dehydrogenase